MHTIDLNSFQVVSSLPETYSLLGATPNLFDQSRTSVGFDIDSLYMFDVNAAIVNQFEHNGAHEPIQEVHMVDENTMLAVTSNSRLYYDIRKLDKEIAVFQVSHLPFIIFMRKASYLLKSLEQTERFFIVWQLA